MANKFGRNYILEVQTQSGSTLTIKPPFTVEFDITRNILSSANVASIRIYNLNANHRGQIRKNVLDFGDLKLVKLKAGYGNNMPIVFNGNVTQAWSVREGSNFITQIESFDGGFAFANASSELNFGKNTSQKTVIESLIADLADFGVSEGVVGDSFNVSLSRGNSYSGHTPALLRELTGGGFFIDNGKAYALGNDEVLSAPVTLIDSSSGLLGTPVREQTIITFDMLFEPKLVAGQKITLNSITEASFNGDYKVVSIKHRGMISDAVCGDAITSVGLLGAITSFKTVGVA